MPAWNGTSRLDTIVDMVMMGSCEYMMMDALAYVGGYRVHVLTKSDFNSILGMKHIVVWQNLAKNISSLK